MSRFVIHAIHVDTRGARPHGRDRAEDEALSERSHQEWARIAPLLPKPAKRGRKPEVDLREVLNAIR